MEKKGLELGFDKVKEVLWQLLHTLKTDKKDMRIIQKAQHE